MEILEWWLRLRHGRGKFKQKGIDTVVMLIIWCVWKERNGRVFGSRPEKTVGQLIDLIIMEGDLWAKASAKWLAALGWPSSATQG
ncbi:unnamed protein product [Urochloa decumbens]